MNDIDQFESVFRSAIRDVYECREINFNTILVVTDLDINANENYCKQVKQFFEKNKKMKKAGSV